MDRATEQGSFSIRSEWDAALTYDDLSTAGNGAGGPIFVGRENLLDVIVGAIRQPDRRGTFLVSGYRGAGKTTLLIEGIRRGRKLLPEKWRLLPLVLNASEVSASLPVTPAASGAASNTTALQIGPQQLLTALIRVLRNHAEEAQRDLPSDLKSAILETYRKAMAKEYSRSEIDQHQRTLTLTRESEQRQTSADAYKRLGAAGAVAATVIEGSAWMPPTWGTALHALAASAGLIAAASWTASRKLSESAKRDSSQAVSVKFDNSLQQLEGDLKELLTKLHSQHLRVVVFLEELDKIRDEDGAQLDAVIRYFKNLFTQAPALFFFVTDKAYYDFIAGEIRRARRARSYAIQHTFFTHRLFVGRPSTRDCLNYLKSILVDQTAAQRLDQLYAPGGIDPFSRTTAEDPLLRLARSLLFKASNHLFDLKNELRRFVRSDGVNLVIDAGALSEDDVAAGIFQDLIVQKYGLFAYPDGRPYVNEVLNDCLYAVFTDLGSDSIQEVSSCYPRARAAAAIPAAPGQPATATAPVTGSHGLAAIPAAGEDQLELSEQLRVRTAVDSLIEDLQRGGAFDAEKTNITLGQFVWKRTASRDFRFLRRMERYENALLDRLERLRSAVAAFGSGGALANLVGLQSEANAFLTEIDRTKKTVETTDRTLPVDETEKLGSEWERRATEPIAKAFRAHTDRIQSRYGLTFDPIGQNVEGGTLLLLRSAMGSMPSHESNLGAVLLAQGEGGRLDDDVREFVGRQPGLRRLAIVHVLHVPGDATALDARRTQWHSQLSEAIRQRTASGLERVLVVECLALDEGWPSNQVAERWGDALAERLMLHAAWTELASAADDGSQAALLSRQLDAKESVVERWLKGEERVLHVHREGSRTDLAEMCAAALARVDSPEVVGCILTTERPDPTAQLAERLREAVAGRSDHMDRTMRVAERLVAQGQLIPIVATNPLGKAESEAAIEWERVARIIGGQGRAIVIAPGSWGKQVQSDVTTSAWTPEPALPS